MVDQRYDPVAVPLGNPLEQGAFQAFAANFRGELIRSGADGYDSARAVFNSMIDRHPALIVRCTGVADVTAAVNLARDNELLVAVRGGGHSVPGYALCEGGIVIHHSPMRGIWVDPDARTASAQASVTRGEFDREAQQPGLAATGGRVTHTGIAGLILGSGSGWLERKYGLTCDNLISADVVTANGEFVQASEEENEDLFWGLRGVLTEPCAVGSGFIRTPMVASQRLVCAHNASAYRSASATPRPTCRRRTSRVGMRSSGAS